MRWPLREFARGKACTARLQGCKLDNETSVLAHVRTPGVGIALKPLDSMALIACAHCHDIIDARKSTGMMPKEVLWRIIAGMAETHEQLIEEGLMVIEKHGTG